MDSKSRYTLRTDPVLLEKLGYIAEYEGRTKNRELEQRPVAKPRTPHPIPQAAQLFKPKTANAAGSRGKAPRPFSRGFKGDTLFREREYPPLAHSRTVRESPDGLRPS